jgi:glycosyltransferase involved in cell wall biosynthesis
MYALLRHALATRARPASRRGPHLLLIVENLSLARDHRLQKQVRTLSESGYRVSVVCRADPGNHALREARVYDYPPPADGTSKLSYIAEYGYSLLMAGWLALKVFLTEPFDAIQISGTPDIYFTIGALFKLLGRPLVLDQRDLSPELYAIRYGRRDGMVYRLLCWLERMTYRVADHVVTVNRSLETIVQRRGRLPPQKVTVVGNGPVLARTGQRSPRSELKAGKRYLCCWLGLMGPQDRLDVALQAIHHLVRVMGRTDCHFAFIGDGETRRASQQRAAELGIDRWTSFPGWADQDEAFTYLSTADLAIEPNLEEIVSPVKAMEYMAFGVPFIAFDLKETRILAAEAAAYAVPGDIAGFARLIDSLLDQPARRAEMGRTGRRLFEERIAWDRQALAYLDVYRRLLGQRRRSGPGVRQPTSSLERVRQ